ncbi:hypothetical protein NL529_32315, partial [Klebsiella pneumoniae]|nr:hypothetical protein [Klebsiella pneumoniae]
VFALLGGWMANRRHSLLERVRAHERQLRRDFETTVTSLVAAIEAKDPTTEGHVQRVAAMAGSVGVALGLDPGALEILRWGAL